MRGFNERNKRGKGEEELNVKEGMKEEKRSI